MSNQEITNISQFLLKKIEYKIISVNMKGFFVSYKAVKKNKQIFVYSTDLISKKNIKDYYFNQTLQMCKKSHPQTKLIIVAKKVDPSLKKYICHYSNIESEDNIDNPWKILLFKEVKKIYTDYVLRESPDYIDSLLKELRKDFF